MNFYRFYKINLYINFVMLVSTVKDVRNVALILVSDHRRRMEEGLKERTRSLVKWEGQELDQDEG